ncbi:MAG: DUF58 domain-containing protein, partial [Pseudomonadota bacterium]|nr:DUF58 domain-containing protein [Pseudomonadota bacterium]
MAAIVLGRWRGRWSWRRRFEDWVNRRLKPQRTPILLHRRRIYILPTGFGYTFAAMLAVMLLWAINYNNSMGFVLTFLLAAVAVNAMWRSHANLLGLVVHPASVGPVFAGQTARFAFTLDNPTPQPRYGVAVQGRDGAIAWADLPAAGSGEFPLPVAAPRRGLLTAGRLRVLTRFPLGLFQAWSWVEFDQVCLVYPQPGGGLALPLRVARAGGEGGEGGEGREDYAGLRTYRPGDSPRHIAWKAVAREGGLLVKRFTAQARTELWLDWDLLAPAGVEARLSQLCQWVLKAEAQRRDYGLRLPGLTLPPGSGPN